MVFDGHFRDKKVIFLDLSHYVAPNARKSRFIAPFPL